MLNDEVGPVLVVDRLAKARLDLLGDVEVVKDRHITFVELDDARLFRGDKSDIVFYLVEYLLVVHVDIFV